MNPKPSLAAVLRSLAELAILGRPPDKDTAEPDGNPGSAAQERKEHAKSTAADGAPQRGRR